MADEETVEETPAEAVTEEPIVEESTEVVESTEDDWRAGMAGDDEASLKTLERYETPAAAAKALTEAKAELRKKLEPLKAPGSDATEEDIAAYREAAGIPADQADYIAAVQLDDGVLVGDADKPILEAFAADFHDKNIPPEVLGVAVDRYMKLMEETAEKQAEADLENNLASIAELKEEYGAAYKGNLNALRPYFDGMSEGMYDRLMTGRTADGKLIGDDPEAVRFFIGRALEAQQTGTLIPSNDTKEATIKSEIAELETMMRTDRDGWFKNTAAQERYRTLINAQEKQEAA